jgi:hypothetical protein
MLTTIDELREVLLDSRKFRDWKPRIVHRKPLDQNTLVTEKHYSPAELAKAWSCSAEKIRILFRREPGVLRLPSGRAGDGQRGYITMKIPESVAIRVHRRLSAIPQ